MSLLVSDMVDNKGMASQPVTNTFEQNMLVLANSTGQVNTQVLGLAMT